jgi:hypothetical protein
MAHCVVHANGMNVMNVMVVSGFSMQCEEARERVSSAKMIHGISSPYDAYYEASPMHGHDHDLFHEFDMKEFDMKEPIREPNPTRGDNVSGLMVPDGAHQIHADTLRHRTRYLVESRHVTKPLEYGKEHHSRIQAD